MRTNDGVVSLIVFMRDFHARPPVPSWHDLVYVYIYRGYFGVKYDYQSY